MSDLPDPGPETVDKILTDLEECRWSPADVARQARRLRAHIEALRVRAAEIEGLRSQVERLRGALLKIAAGGRMGDPIYSAKEAQQIARTALETPEES